MKPIPVSLFCLSLSLLAAAAAADPIDDFVRQRMQESQIPGVSLAIVKNGEITKAAGYGWANVAAQDPMSPDRVFILDSMTKQFTGITVMQQVERGRIDLDASLRTYISEAPDAWQPITIRNLLTHTAGFPHDIAPEGRLTTAANWRPERWLHAAFRTRLLFTPGARYQYSNAGYCILAIVVQRVSGQGLVQPYEAGILWPVGMSASGVFDEHQPPAGLVTAYVFRDGRYVPGRRFAIPMPAGGLYSTVLDLAKYDKALYSDTLVSAASKEQMWSPMIMANGRRHPYGFGWAIRRLPGGKVVFHNGGGWGFNTAIYRYLDARITVIMLTNHTPPHGTRMNVDRVVRGLSPLIDPSLTWERGLISREDEQLQPPH